MFLKEIVQGQWQNLFLNRTVNNFFLQKGSNLWSGLLFLHIDYSYRSCFPNSALWKCFEVEANVIGVVGRVSLPVNSLSTNSEENEISLYINTTCSNNTTSDHQRQDVLIFRQILLTSYKRNVWRTVRRTFLHQGSQYEVPGKVQHKVSSKYKWPMMAKLPAAGTFWQGCKVMFTFSEKIKAWCQIIITPKLNAK